MSHHYAGGDILAVQKQSIRPFWVDSVLNAGTLVNVVVPRDTNHTVYVHKIVLSILAHANNKDFFAQDTAGTPVVIARHTDKTAAAGVLSVITWDFGPHGVALTAGKGLDVVSEASGIDGLVHCEGYHKLSAVISENGTDAGAN